MENQEKQHKRRVRYAGTHPRNYKEKYKEHNPEKYADTIEKVIRKGGTPAGMHRSIMVEEILEFLQIQPGQTGVDATLGYGGHTKKMLECLRGKGHIYGLDVDPIESAKTKERLANQGFGEEILTVRLQNFADIDQVSRETGKKFDFVLADLGVSSMQIDNPDRGFSYKVEGPLDLRMNPEKGISAAERLKTISGEELTGMLVENADEPYAEEIAEEMHMSVERVREILKISQEPVSLETPIGEEEDSHLGDFIQDDNVPVPADAAAFTMLKEQLEDVLSTLTDREQKVLRLRFGLDDGRARTLEEVGKEFNVTRERIRQIEAKALRKLRHPSRSRKLKDYLD